MLLSMKTIRHFTSQFKKDMHANCKEEIFEGTCYNQCARFFCSEAYDKDGNGELTLDEIAFALQKSGGASHAHAVRKAPPRRGHGGVGRREVELDHLVGGDAPRVGHVHLHADRLARRGGARVDIQAGVAEGGVGEAVAEREERLAGVVLVRSPLPARSLLALFLGRMQPRFQQ